MLAVGGYGLLPISEVDPDLLKSFSCGKAHLDEFLQVVALPYHQQRLGLTNVVLHQDFDGVLGYFTLSNDAVRLKDSEKFDLGVDANISLTYFPAVKICRLAVSKNGQGNGSGRAIMDLIRGDIHDSTSTSAARFIIVDADNDADVLRFYEKQGFERSLFAEGVAKSHLGGRQSTVKMWQDIIAISR